MYVTNTPKSINRNNNNNNIKNESKKKNKYPAIKTIIEIGFFM